MRIKKAAIVPMLVCPLLAVGSAVATGQALSSPAGAAVKVSTLGIGVDVAVPVSERLNVRGEFNTFGLTHDFDQDSITLAAKLKLRSVVAFLDWFPLGGGFHVSPGLMLHNGNRVDANAAVPGGQRFSLGNDELISNPANPVTGTATVSFQRVAPTVLVGWGNIVPRGDRRWSVPFELGIVYSRAPTAVLSLNGSACTTNGAICRGIATEPLLQADLAEEQSQMNSDLSMLKAIPVVSFGFSYKF